VKARESSPVRDRRSITELHTNQLALPIRSSPTPMLLTVCILLDNFVISTTDKMHAMTPSGMDNISEIHDEIDRQVAVQQQHRRLGTAEGNQKRLIVSPVQVDRLVCLASKKHIHLHYSIESHISHHFNCSLNCHTQPLLLYFHSRVISLHFCRFSRLGRIPKR